MQVGLYPRDGALLARGITKAVTVDEIRYANFDLVERVLNDMLYDLANPKEVK